MTGKTESDEYCQPFPRYKAYKASNSRGSGSELCGDTDSGLKLYKCSSYQTPLEPYTAKSQVLGCSERAGERERKGRGERERMRERRGEREWTGEQKNIIK